MPNPIPYPCFLDCEASSLAEHSHPIEIAWNDPDGTVHELLINPQSVPAWTDWDPQSEAIHGISKAQLASDGISAQAAAQQLRAALQQTTIVSDAPWWDARWLRRLFIDAQIRAPEIQIADVDDLCVDQLIATGAHRESARAQLGRLHLQARAKNPARHRAAADVRYLMAVWEGVCAIPGRRGRPRRG